VQIYFNRDNWDYEVARSHFPDRAAYRTYLVWHEMGHAHGLEHETSGAGEECPVMVQQSAAARPTCDPTVFDGC